jgi:hypothetical protein
MAEKRESKRVSFRKIARYGSTLPPKCRGHVVDLSATGIYINTNHVFKPGTRLHIVIEDGDSVHIVEGEVKSAKKVPAPLARSVKCGMGIKFVEPHEELLNIYQDKTGG